MVKLIVVTPKGELVNDDFNIVVAKSDQGEVGILQNRLPIILKITDGFVRGEKYLCCEVILHIIYVE
jgi:F0F1-type ATP synthase epsilon subunit